MKTQRIGLWGAFAIVVLSALHAFAVRRPYPLEQLDPAAGGPLK